MDQCRFESCRGYQIMSHHTKDKGDLGVSAVIFDLTRQGYSICLPLSEHLPFDLIMVSPPTFSTRRIQAKYRALKDGVIAVKQASTYSDSNGAHSTPTDLTSFDGYAIYCPDTSKVYYVPVIEVSDQTAFTLRVDPAKGNSQHVIRYAEMYETPERMFQ